MLDTGLLKALLNIVSTQCLNLGAKNTKNIVELISFMLQSKSLSDDVYVCLYTIRTLAALAKAGGQVCCS
jgi:hypothetical protein